MRIPENPRIILAGSVNSSLQTLNKLIEHKCNVVAVLGLHPDNARKVSGFVNLRSTSRQNNIPFKYFNKINDQEVIDFISSLNADLLFVVGLSQLVKEPLLSVANYGNVGFHPTKLPQGRGRGAVAWLILGKAPGAATFFILEEGMDSGPVLAQQEFEIFEEDYASDVIKRIETSIGQALDHMLPKLKKGKLNPQIQNHDQATYLGRRKPIDGLINWNDSAKEIYRLIRATSKPLPGAYTFWDNQKLIVHRASLERKDKYFGIPGRILEVEGERILVACKEGSLWLEEYESDTTQKLRVGTDFGKT